MSLWTRANTLWVIATVLVLVASQLSNPLQTILLVIAGCVIGAATHQRLRSEIPPPGQETLIDRFMGAAMMFFIVMAIVIFISIPFLEMIFDNTTVTPALFVVVMLCVSAVGSILQFFFGMNKSSSKGVSKTFIVTVVIVLCLAILYSIPLFFPRT